MGVLACKRYHGQSCIIIEDVWKSNYFLVQPLNKAAHEHLCQLSRNIGMEVIPKENSLDDSFSELAEKDDRIFSLTLTA